MKKKHNTITKIMVLSFFINGLLAMKKEAEPSILLIMNTLQDPNHNRLVAQPITIHDHNFTVRDLQNTCSDAGIINKDKDLPLYIFNTADLSDIQKLPENTSVLDIINDNKDYYLVPKHLVKNMFKIAQEEKEIKKKSKVPKTLYKKKKTLYQRKKSHHKSNTI